MTIQLDFEFDNRAHESIAYVGGDEDTALYRVRMVRDDSPENPFEAWDGHWPMLAHYDRHTREYGDVPCPIACLTDGQIVRHQRAIAAAIDGYGSDTWHAMRDECLENQRYYGGPLVDHLRDYLSDALSDISHAGDKFSAMAEIYAIAGIPALATCSTGYCQGDYSELLIVAPWDVARGFGWNKAQWKRPAPADLESQAELYGYWAWGDVYGYICERRDNPESNWEDLPDFGASVWGFYGDNPHKSGLAEQAGDAIASDIRQRRKARLSKLAELIKSRVPLAIRAMILGAPEYAVAGEAN